MARATKKRRKRTQANQRGDRNVQQQRHESQEQRPVDRPAPLSKEEQYAADVDLVFAQFSEVF